MRLMKLRIGYATSQQAIDQGPIVAMIEKLPERTAMETIYELPGDTGWHKKT